MSYKCPHCQKPIAVKMKMELTTQEILLDQHMEKNGKEKKDDQRHKIGSDQNVF